jgi:hypothetical protein
LEVIAVIAERKDFAADQRAGEQKKRQNGEQSEAEGRSLLAVGRAFTLRPTANGERPTVFHRRAQKS